MVCSHNTYIRHSWQQERSLPASNNTRSEGVLHIHTGCYSVFFVLLDIQTPILNSGLPFSTWIWGYGNKIKKQIRNFRDKHNMCKKRAGQDTRNVDFSCAKFRWGTGDCLIRMTHKHEWLGIVCQLTAMSRSNPCPWTVGKNTDTKLGEWSEVVRQAHVPRARMLWGWEKMSELTRTCLKDAGFLKWKLISSIPHPTTR